RRKPTSEGALPAFRGLAHNTSGIASSDWIQAVEAGLTHSDMWPGPPPPAARPDGGMIGARRRLGDLIATFRRKEAARRGVAEEGVLPARCVGEWIDSLLCAPAGEGGLEAVLRSRMSLGPTREQRYLRALVDLAAEA